MAEATLFIEASLIHRLQVRSEMEVAARTLLAQIGPSLLRYFRSRGGLTEEQAEDALQETMLRVIRSAASLRSEENAAPWIWAIGRNTMFEQVRSLARKNEVESDLPEEVWDSIEETVAHPKSCATDVSVDECVDGGISIFESHLPERAMALRLVMDGMEISELAGHIGRSYDATKVYLFECRKKLKPFIQHCIEILRTKEQNA